MRHGLIVLVIACIASGSPHAFAADLKPVTVAAFDRYERAAEAAIGADLSHPGRFVRSLRPNVPTSGDAREALARGDVWVERLQATDGGSTIEIPDGLVHHWLGAVFIPGTRADAAVKLLQDYDRHAEYFKPHVVASRTLERAGGHFRLLLRFYFKKVIAVTVNTESTADFTEYGDGRVSSRIRSTRIAEVENAGTPRERELPVGRDGGFLWRLNTYWRFVERDGGTYIECESLTLTRGMPLGLGWLIGPFVTSVPRETLTMTLQATRKALLAVSGEGAGGE